MKNHITLYSSGIGVLVRQADIGKGAVTFFRIPIKKSHRMDVIASLRVFGNGIKLQDSIAWPQDEKTQLTIDPTKVQESLLTQLSGRNIKFKPKQGLEATGINLGLQTQTEMISDHRTVERPYVVIQVDKGGINRYALDQIDSLEFTEPDVNAEIVKAYQNNAAKLREDITFVNFSIVPKDANTGAKAYYQYAFPNPAWQPTYRLNETKDGKFLLSCYAKADIQCEEELEDCGMAFVVGEPDTFETDLADAVLPRRRRVNLVKARASGGDIAEHGLAEDVYNGDELATSLAGAATFDRADVAMSMRHSPRVAALARAAPVPATALTDFAATGGAETTPAIATEVGDYSRWTTPYGQNIKVRQSCLVPLFTDQEFKETRRVLYYSHPIQPKRPKLALQLRNGLGQSLGTGVCTVYRDDAEGGSDLTGTAILQTIKPGETTMLLYGTETGVQVRREQPPDTTDHLQLFSISDGVLTLEVFKRITTIYRFKSIKTEDFQIIVDHQRYITDSEIEASSQVMETLDNGVRIAIALNAKGEATLGVTETKVVESTVTLTPDNWLNYYNTWQATCDLGKNKDVQKIVRAKEALDAKVHEINALNVTSTRLLTTQKRLVGLIKEKAGAEQQIGKWQQEVGTTEEVIKKNETRLPKLQKERDQLQSALYDTIKALQAEWKGRPPGVAIVKN